MFNDRSINRLLNNPILEDVEKDETGKYKAKKTKVGNEGSRERTLGPYSNIDEKHIAMLTKYITKVWSRQDLEVQLTNAFLHEIGFDPVKNKVWWPYTKSIENTPNVDKKNKLTFTKKAGKRLIDLTEPDKIYQSAAAVNPTKNVKGFNLENSRPLSKSLSRLYDMLDNIVGSASTINYIDSDNPGENNTFDSIVNLINTIKLYKNKNISTSFCAIKQKDIGAINTTLKAMFPDTPPESKIKSLLNKEVPITNIKINQLPYAWVYVLLNLPRFIYDNSINQNISDGFDLLKSLNNNNNIFSRLQKLFEDSDFVDLEVDDDDDDDDVDTPIGNDTLIDDDDDDDDDDSSGASMMIDGEEAKSDNNLVGVYNIRSHILGKNDTPYYPHGAPDTNQDSVTKELEKNRETRDEPENREQKAASNEPVYHFITGFTPEIVTNLFDRCWPIGIKMVKLYDLTVQPDNKVNVKKRSTPLSDEVISQIEENKQNYRGIIHDILSLTVKDTGLKDNSGQFTKLKDDTAVLLPRGLNALFYTISGNVSTFFNKDNKLGKLNADFKVEKTLPELIADNIKQAKADGEANSIEDLKNIFYKSIKECEFDSYSVSEHETLSTMMARLLNVIQNEAYHNLKADNTDSKISKDEYNKSFNYDIFKKYLEEIRKNPAKYANKKMYKWGYEFLSFIKKRYKGVNLPFSKEAPENVNSYILENSNSFQSLLDLLCLFELAKSSLNDETYFNRAFLNRDVHQATDWDKSFSVNDIDEAIDKNISVEELLETRKEEEILDCYNKLIKLKSAGSAASDIDKENAVLDKITTLTPENLTKTFKKISVNLGDDSGKKFLDVWTKVITQYKNQAGEDLNIDDVREAKKKILLMFFKKYNVTKKHVSYKDKTNKSNNYAIKLLRGLYDKFDTLTNRSVQNKNKVILNRIYKIMADYNAEGKFDDDAVNQKVTKELESCFDLLERESGNSSDNILKKLVTIGGGRLLTIIFHRSALAKDKNIYNNLLSKIIIKKLNVDDKFLTNDEFSDKKDKTDNPNYVNWSQPVKDANPNYIYDVKKNILLPALRNKMAIDTDGNIVYKVLLYKGKNNNFAGLKDGGATVAEKDGDDFVIEKPIINAGYLTAEQYKKLFVMDINKETGGEKITVSKLANRLSVFTDEGLEFLINSYGENTSITVDDIRNYVDMVDRDIKNSKLIKDVTVSAAKKIVKFFNETKAREVVSLIFQAPNKYFRQHLLQSASRVNSRQLYSNKNIESQMDKNAIETDRLSQSIGALRNRISGETDNPEMANIDYELSEFYEPTTQVLDVLLTDVNDIDNINDVLIILGGALGISWRIMSDDLQYKDERWDSEKEQKKVNDSTQKSKIANRIKELLAEKIGENKVKLFDVKFESNIFSLDKGRTKSIGLELQLLLNPDRLSVYDDVFDENGNNINRTPRKIPFYFYTTDEEKDSWEETLRNILSTVYIETVTEQFKNTKMYKNDYIREKLGKLMLGDMSEDNIIEGDNIYVDDETSVITVMAEDEYLRERLDKAAALIIEKQDNKDSGEDYDPELDSEIEKELAELQKEYENNSGAFNQNGFNSLPDDDAYARGISDRLETFGRQMTPGDTYSKHIGKQNIQDTQVSNDVDQEIIINLTESLMDYYENNDLPGLIPNTPNTEKLNEQPTYLEGKEQLEKFVSDNIDSFNIIKDDIEFYDKNTASKEINALYYALIMAFFTRGKFANEYMANLKNALRNAVTARKYKNDSEAEKTNNLKNFLDNLGKDDNLGISLDQLNNK